MEKIITPSLFILDVDGVMTDGSFTYSEQGKTHKSFGADDADGLALLSNYMKIRFVSADKRGFPITKKRIAEDMGYPLDCVSSAERIEWIKSLEEAQNVIYMGDGFYDFRIFDAVGYGIAPENALQHTKDKASFVTSRKGGDRAVAQACLHIIDTFFGGANAALYEPKNK
ncbi:MAG: HAD hydrolase family protein [Alphaproteobacteria bacterium]|nr:HAD hydrolase family protein [Alphaproteobacteria bacterium]